MNRHVIAAIAAIIVGLQVYVRTRAHVALTFDGWVYWEGAVSLLDGSGYRTLDGQAIVTWPPLFSSSLAVWGSLFGLTFDSLKIAMITFAAIGGYVWAIAWQLHTRDSGRLTVAVGLLVIVAYLPAWYDTLLSEVVWVPLVGVIVILLSRRSIDIRSVASFTGVLILCLLARNQSVVLLPSILVFFAILYGRKDIRNISIALILTVVLWALLRQWTGSSGSHELASLHSAGQLPDAFRRAISVTYPLLGISAFHISQIVILLVGFLVVCLPVLKSTGRFVGGRLSHGAAWFSFSLCFWASTIAATLMVGIPADQSRFYMLPVMLVALSCVLLFEASDSVTAKAVAGTIVVLTTVSFIYREIYFLGPYAPPAEIYQGDFVPTREWVDSTSARIEQSVRQGRSLQAAAGEFGLSANTYRRWRGLPLH